MGDESANCGVHTLDNKVALLYTITSYTAKLLRSPVLGVKGT